MESGNFATIAWGAGSHFVQVKLDATGGTDFQLMGTSKLLSVPYALHAKTADRLSEDSKTYAVGDFAQGGVVFWVDERGEHGLVCAIEDQGEGDSMV